MSDIVDTPGKIRYDSIGEAYFLTFSCFRGHHFLASERTLIWVAASLNRACEVHSAETWGYVFMPNHVHLIVFSEHTDFEVGRFLLSFKESVTRKAIAYRNASNKPPETWERYLDVHPDGKVHFRIWQRGGGYNRSLWSREEISEKLEYIHKNPVRRGLVESPLDWKWSSARYYEYDEIGPVIITRPDLT
jgi:putative transposase